MSEVRRTASASVLPVAAVALVALFVTALVTAQLTASKILLFSLPVSLPVVGPALALPGAALAYAVTFFASDCYSELYGRRAAQTMVNVGFVMNLVLLVLVWGTIAAPAADSGFADQFAAVLGASTNIVVGSLLAYLVSQNWDVLVFHRIREATDGEMLWLRNVGSTATSQLLDTVIFVTVAFAVAPAVLGVGSVTGGSELLALVVGQYLLKLLIAVVDTPFVYLVVRAARDRGVAPRVTPSD
ncbi:queuosine precursor transporter [Halomarina oriensis]|uniref:Probable queuosine precursor transporter n=1 Tax=Halomarina oriensis TaxID=671145 RepID=A0A6B0GIM9_9EURY|nr:queuosine precursor transporter [Halomarina oriensis]MWG34736.1 queuosine precursor transporter [Halomarina oriensis]